MININVFSEEKAWSKKLKEKELFFKKICNSLPKKYKFPNEKVSLSLMLSNNKNIKKLNKSFRNKNKSTDILSFPFEKKNKISKKKYLGDIIISYDFMNKPKSQGLNVFKEKLVRTFIHGFLHLLGYDHKTEKQFKQMKKFEDLIYKTIKHKV